jgi:hypothetical protein
VMLQNVFTSKRGETDWRYSVQSGDILQFECLSQYLVTSWEVSVTTDELWRFLSSELQMLTVKIWDKMFICHVIFPSEAYYVTVL